MRIGPPLAAVLLLFVWRALFHGWVFDDSYIAFRFSHNWAAGHGLTWNPGQDPVEGFTSFAWVTIGALVESVFRIPPHQSMIVFGLACWAFLIALLLPRLAEDVAGDDGKVAALFTVLVLAMNPYLAFNAFHGLETELQVLAFAVVAGLALREPTQSNETALAAASFLSYTVRPDALAFVLPVWAIRFWITRSDRSRIVKGFLAFAAALAVYTHVKSQWFGYPLPNTFYIKQGGLLSGLGYVRTWLLALTPAWLLLAFAAWRAGLSRLLRDRAFLILALPALAFCLAYVKLNPILGDGYRFLIPTLPLIVLACLRASALSPNRRVDLAVYGLAMSAALLVFGYQMYREYSGLRTYFTAIDRTLVPTGHKLAAAATLEPPPLLATGDIGAMPYFSGLRTLDLIGLADETVAHDGLTHAYLKKSNPDLLILQDLYLTKTIQPGDLVLQVGDGPRAVDRARYAKVLTSPERDHTGAGSTWQVVTTPGFADRYRHVTDWDFAGWDRYWVFVRRDYPHADELAALLRQGP